MSEFRLCLFGLIGICPKNDTEIKTLTTIQNNTLNTFLNETIQSSINHSGTSINNTQIIKIKSGGNVDISGVSLDQYASLTSSTSINIQKSITDDTNVNQMIDALAKNSIDFKGTSLGSNGTVLNSTETKVINEVKNQFKTYIKQEDLSECINMVINEQKLDIETTGNVVLSCISLKQSASAITTCVINSVLNAFSKIKLSQELQNEVDNSIKSEITSPIEDIGKGILDPILAPIKQAISGTTSIITTVIIVICVIIACIIGIVLIIVIYYIAKLIIGMFKSKKEEIKTE